jgi:type VI secretion system ImpC/EvpB family protein
MGGRLEFDFKFGPGQARRRVADGAPFRVLLVHDFSGRAAARARGVRAPLRRPIMVDAENVDRAVATFAPTLVVAGASKADEPETLSFASLDDLHADALFRQMPRFETARRLHRALATTSSGEDALAAAEAWLLRQGEPPQRASEPPTDRAAESTDSTLERLLGRTPSKSAAPGSSASSGGAKDMIGSLLAQVVSPHIAPDVAARRKVLLGAMDEKIGRELRALLAAPELRALEGAWRGAERVIRELGTDQELQIGLFDACKEDLVEAIGDAGGDLERSELHQLVAGGAGGWTVIAVGFAFAPDANDLRLLATLGAMAARAGAVLVGDAAPMLVGAPDTAKLSDPTTWAPAFADGAAEAFWQALRASPLAPAIALAAPRVLARLPYGKKTEPMSELSFEELAPGAGAGREHRVWSSASFAVAEVLGRAFREQGWQMDPTGPLDLDDLPAHSFDADGTSELVPCTEVLLSQRAAASARERGIVPLLAHRDRASVRVGSLGSIAESGVALAGAWASSSE